MEYVLYFYPWPSKESCKMKHITQELRYSISALIIQGFSKSKLAEAIKVHKSAAGREIQRNSDERNHQYKHGLAMRKCMKRHYEKPKHTIYTSNMGQKIAEGLLQKYSLEQIHGRATLEIV